MPEQPDETTPGDGATSAESGESASGQEAPGDSASEQSESAGAADGGSETPGDAGEGEDAGTDESASEPDASSDSADDQSESAGDDSSGDAGDGADEGTDAGAVEAARNDADTNFGGESPDETVAPCPVEVAGGAKKPGNLEVTVLDAKTGKPIPGATVDITGPAASSGTTDDSGKVQKNGVPAGDYTATAKNPGYTTEKGTAPVPAGGTGKIEIKLTPITVTITLAQPVACPGHPLEITAAGSPAGGTYAWTITVPAGDLVDAAGTTTRSGDKVNLRGFQSDTTTGDIPAQTAKIGVTYTYTNGQTAAANQDVVIHEIKFQLTDDSISKSPTAANETATVLDITFGASATMSTDPKVEIDLDASCPRKTDCAKNHQTGWLQTVLTSVVDLRYTHTRIQVTPPMPVRDAIAGVVAPFYLAPIPFTGDKDKQTVHHEDSPGVKAPWTDPRPASPAPPPPKNKQLRSVIRSMSFTAWLVVQNIEWFAHHPADCYAFVGHFDWSMSITVAVDFTKAVGSRGSPHSSPPTVPAKISKGKGGSSPDLGAVVYNTTANDPANQHVDPAPEI